MGADLSRIRYNGQNNFAGVELKQGGVVLDADINEYVAVVDRHLRAAASDILGRSRVSSTTPDAFKISPVPGGLQIDKGRLYVDGLLAENHGAASADPAKKLFDPLMAEPVFADPVAYSAQPYLPNAPALPTTDTHLVYLDVWQRELTHLGRPDLVEVAVGVETSSRVQTVWQVRVLEADGATCSTPDEDLAGWSELIAPSSGRLTTGTFDVPPSSDPCELPPTGGYRGLENQTYRVEIHNPGQPGGSATFKWSDNNACVGSRVASLVSPMELELQTLGRDDVLRFNTGDWVEVIDDVREFSQRCGEMCRITAVNEAARRITIEPALPAEMLPAPPTFPNSDFPRDGNMRVVRWDEKHEVLQTGAGGTTSVFQDLDAPGSTGVIRVPAAGTTLLLENGVTVSFRSTGDKGFRAGDYWVFAARTADASVELLEDAPPRGIHHHYERLGIWDADAGTVTDCRHPWPPDGGGCCTVMVEPGEDIQAALDGLPPEGGCVCLKTGVHEIAAPIEIRSSRIILHGESPGAIVRSTGATTLLGIGAPTQQVRDIVVERIRFEATAPAGAGIVWSLDNCLRVRLAHCQVEALAPSPATPPFYLGAALNEASNVVITANTFANVMRGVTVTDSSRVEISGNTLTAPVLNLGPGQLPLGDFGVLVQAESERPCTIEDNRLQNFWTAVSLGPGADASFVTGNRIRRAGLAAEGPVPGTAEALREYLDQLHFAIDADAARCIVRGNDIDLTSAFWGGIRASAAHATIEGNTLESTVKGGSPAVLLPAGIYCRPSAAQATAADHAVVRENRLAGPQLGIVVSRVDGASVDGNHIDGGQTGWFGVRVDDCTTSRIGTNDIDDMLFGVYAAAGADNRITGNQIRRTGLGIVVDAEAGLAVCDNTVQSAPAGGVILLFVTGPTTVAGNRIANCGYAPPGTLGALGLVAISLDLFAPSATGIRIEGCEILDTGIPELGGQAASVAALGMLVWAPACQVSNNRIAYRNAGGLDTQQQHRAMKLIGPLGVRIQLGTGIVEIMFGNALVLGNTLRGPGRHNLVEFQRIIIDDHFDFRFEKVSFSNNVCEHLNAEASASEATVRLWGGHLISMGNHVKGPAGVHSMSLAGRSHVALMGNVTTGDYINVGTVTPPAPLTNFNVRV